MSRQSGRRKVIKRVIAHAFSALIGVLIGVYGCLVLASFTSIAWQDDLKLNASHSIRKEAAIQASRENWEGAASLFLMARKIDNNLKPKTWSIRYPIKQWRLAGGVRIPEDTFEVSDYSSIAFSLKMAGREADAEKIYNMLKAGHQNMSIERIDAMARSNFSALSPESNSRKANGGIGN